MSRFIGVAREYVFSPGREGDDDAVFALVAENLRAAGHGVATCRGDDAVWPEPGPDTRVFTMCQGERALDRLRSWEDRGIRIVNGPAAILNCQRHQTIPLLQAAGVPMPESVLLELTGNGPQPPLQGPVWVKRGDVHATEAGDVVFAAEANAVRAALQRFRARGIRRAVVQQHVPGTVVKFYAVCHRFFHAVPPAQGVVLAADLCASIRTVGERAAAALGVEVYGGDCVCREDGTPVVIDLNDWPSYAPCRSAAAVAIADHLLGSETPTHREPVSELP